MGCENSTSREKKTPGYKQRCDEKRATYREDLTVKEADGKSAVYVDECGFCDESFRPYAYAPKGETILGLISSQRTRKTTMVAARLEETFTAFSLFEGSCNAERFNTWLEGELCPHLSSEHLVIMDNARIHKTERTRELIENTERFNTWLEGELCPHLSSEHLVIMDNARIHKTERTRELIENTGAEILFLPPYSPDYNPIEHDFANIKRLREYNADIPLNEVIDMYHKF